jgi:D-3-phosphoglycerate dehydrogenase
MAAPAAHAPRAARPAELLVLGQIEPSVAARLAERHGVRVVEDSAALESALEGAASTRVIVVRSPFRVTRETMDRCPELRAIVRAGSGTDNIDLAAAGERGVRVLTTPLASTSVAELAFGLLMAVARQIPLMHRSLCEGEWRKWEAAGTEITGSTLLVVGFGRIGQEVARVAGGFRMRVLVADPTPHKPEKEQALRETGATVRALDEALAHADSVILCCPLTPATRGMLGAAELGRMKRGAILVNVARDELVDGAALLDALRGGRLGGAAIDGFSGPNAVDAELMAHPCVVGTPHVGAQTREAHERIGTQIERLVDELLTPEHP